jgi:hypothetical protein
MILSQHEFIICFIPVNILPERVVAGEHDDGAETD